MLPHTWSGFCVFLTKNWETVFFSLKRLRVKPRLSNRSQLCVTKQPQVWAKWVEPSRHRDKSLSVCKGQLCSSCQVRWPRSLEGHILAYGRPPAVLLNLETQIHEETSWLSVLVKWMAHFKTFKGKSNTCWFVHAVQISHHSFSISMDAWYTSSLVFTRKPTLSVRKLKLREVKRLAQGASTVMLGNNVFFIPKLLLSWWTNGGTLGMRKQ